MEDSQKILNIKYRLKLEFLLYKVQNRIDNIKNNSLTDINNSIFRPLAASAEMAEYSEVQGPELPMSQDNSRTWDNIERKIEQLCKQKKSEEYIIDTIADFCRDYCKEYRMEIAANILRNIMPLM